MSEVPSVPKPTELTKRVAQAFADHGDLSEAMPEFEPRSSQRRMAIAAAELFEKGGILLAEAGTGIGKTLAYLVPAILSGQRVLVSTGTKNLQDQIFYKDLPALREAFETPITATYMKGRNNYLCLHRFEALRQGELEQTHVDNDTLEELSEWAAQTDTGDRAEVENLSDNIGFWNSVAATSENCIGTNCPDYQQCFVTKMRERASECDLVIVNHHLLCADAAVRQSAYGEVIPLRTYAVIDEAHQLEDVATQYFGVSVSTRRLQQLELQGQQLLNDRVDLTIKDEYLAELKSLLLNVSESASSFFNALRLLDQISDRVGLTADILQPASPSGQRLIQDLHKFSQALRNINSSSEDINAIERSTRELQEQLSFLLETKDQNFVYVLEKSQRGVVLRASPIDVSGVVREFLFNRMNGTVLTSATLTIDSSFQYLRNRLGISDAVELKLASEFDYQARSIMYLPQDIPEPSNPEFAEAVSCQVSELLQISRGRAFVLFTSYSNLRDVQARLEPTLPFPILVQGNAPRTVLLREFRNTPNAVLLATSSFWQGVDVAGEALSCVIIDKLPFASPNDPLTAARMQKISDEGGNPFTDYQIPLVVLSLLQGLGRLLRHRTDYGVMALLDSRIRTKGYGRRVMASLPPAPITHDLSDIKRFFEQNDRPL